MVGSGAMPDASHLWWAIRPSLKYPTLELRAPDCCTRLDDTVAIAALYRSLARFLYANAGHNAELDVVDRAIAVENKWRAQRYGAQGTFVTPIGRHRRRRDAGPGARTCCRRRRGVRLRR